MLLAPFSQDKAVAENELKVLKELSHDHVLVYVDSFVSTERVCIVTEYCSGGDLSGFLKHIGRPVPEDLLLVWLWQMACGLEVCGNAQKIQDETQQRLPHHRYIK